MNLMNVNAYVHIQFQMKDLDSLKNVLGIDVAQSTSNIVIFLEKICSAYSHPSVTSMDPSLN